MPSLIKLDMDFSLVIELKLAIVDTDYFVGLTLCRKLSNSNWGSPEINSQGDDARHMNSKKNFSQRRPSSFFMEGRTVSIKVYSLIFCYKLSLPWTILECSKHIKHDKQNIC